MLQSRAGSLGLSKALLVPIRQDARGPEESQGVRHSLSSSSIQWLLASASCNLGAIDEAEASLLAPDLLVPRPFLVPRPWQRAGASMISATAYT